ncbi:hypothetical protein PG987_001820 [Apiospora arundinis]
MTRGRRLSCSMVSPEPQPVASGVSRDAAALFYIYSWLTSFSGRILAQTTAVASRIHIRSTSVIWLPISTGRRICQGPELGNTSGAVCNARTKASHLASQLVTAWGSVYMPGVHLFRPAFRNIAFEQTLATNGAARGEKVGPSPLAAEEDEMSACLGGNGAGEEPQANLASASPLAPPPTEAAYRHCAGIL